MERRLRRIWRVLRSRRGRRGSVLVFSLLVMAMLLSAALTGAAAIIATRNSARASEKSVLVYPIADAAIESILYRIYKHADVDATLNDFAGHLSGFDQCGVIDSGVIGKTPPSGISGTYTAIFLDNNGSVITCNDTAWRSKVVKIRVSGIYAGLTRVIEVGIAP